MQFPAKRRFFARRDAWRCSVRLQALAVLWLVCDAPAARADAGCAQPHVRWQNDVPLQWQRALLAACDDLAATQGLDQSVDVRASQRRRELDLEVVASGGRTTKRSVRTTDELLMTMQALVLLPPSQRVHASAPASAPQPERSPEPPPQAATTATPRFDARRQALQVEIGAALMGRLAFIPEYISPALWLSVGMHLQRFTIGIDVRWNPMQTLIARAHPVGLEIESLGAGLFAVHRVIESDWTGLDLGFHAFLSADTRAWEQDETATESTLVDGRVGVIARWGFGSKTARWTLLMDAELSPARLGAHVDFPTFSFGVGGGGVWEVK